MEYPKETIHTFLQQIESALQEPILLTLRLQQNQHTIFRKRGSNFFGATQTHGLILSKVSDGPFTTIIQSLRPPEFRNLLAYLTMHATDFMMLATEKDPYGVVIHGYTKHPFVFCTNCVKFLDSNITPEYNENTPPGDPRGIIKIPGIELNLYDQDEGLPP